EDIPVSWTDILDPKWTDLIGLASIDAGGSAFIAQTFLREKVDPEFWSKFAAVEPRFYQSTPPAVTDLARGELSLILGSGASLVQQVQEGAPVQVIFPTEG